MARLLIAWEIAGGFGHLVQIAPVADALRARGHHIALACANTAEAQRFANARQTPLFDDIVQAPRVHGPDPVTGSTPRSYADILHYWGYHSHEGFEDVTRRWQPLMQAADAILCHHAPSALGAAEVLGMPVVRFGDGYTVPPDTSPLADITHWAPQSRQDKADTEARLLAILRAGGGPAFEHLGSVGEMLGRAADFLTTWPFLDHYPQRRDAYYYGPLMVDIGTALPDWPEGSNPRLLAYMSAGHPALGRLLEALQSLGWPCCLYSPGDVPSAPDNVRVSSEPFAMGEAVRQADIVIGHASHGTSAQAIRAGKPMVVLPLNAEQSMIGWQLAQLGTGLPVPAPFSAEAIAAAIRQVEGNHGFAARAASVAEMVKDYDAKAAVADMAEDICTALGIG